MSAVFYLIPMVVVVVLALVAKSGQKRALASVANLSPGDVQARLSAFYAGSFDLGPGEAFRSVWISEEYQGEAGVGRQVAGAALNSLSKAAVGLKVYVPQVRIALTTSGRVLFSREHSDFGMRGKFKQIAAFEPGTRALDAATAHPGQPINARMQNPLGGAAPPVFVQFRSPSGQVLEVWLTAGQTMNNDDFISTFNGMSGVAA